MAVLVIYGFGVRWFFFVWFCCICGCGTLLQQLERFSTVGSQSVLMLVTAVATFSKVCGLETLRG